MILCLKDYDGVVELEIVFLNVSTFAILYKLTFKNGVLLVPCGEHLNVSTFAILYKLTFKNGVFLVPCGEHLNRGMFN